MREDEIKIGLDVIYWSIIKGDGTRLNPLKTKITSEPWKLGHNEIVCKVKGVAGGVSIKHLDTITPGSLMAANLQGCKDVSMDDFENETKTFFESKGINAIITMSNTNQEY